MVFVWLSSNQVYLCNWCIFFSRTQIAFSHIPVAFATNAKRRFSNRWNQFQLLLLILSLLFVSFLLVTNICKCHRHRHRHQCGCGTKLPNVNTAIITFLLDSISRNVWQSMQTALCCCVLKHIKTLNTRLSTLTRPSFKQLSVWCEPQNKTKQKRSKSKIVQLCVLGVLRTRLCTIKREKKKV